MSGEAGAMAAAGEGGQRFEESLYARAFELAPDGQLLVDGEGRIAGVNQAAERLFGYERRELLGQPVELLVPAAHAEAHEGLRARYLAAPVSRAMGARRELSARRKDGGEVPVDIMLGVVSPAPELRVLAVVRDRSEAARAEREARAAARRFRNLETWFVAAADQLDRAVVATDEERRVVVFSHAAEAITGWRAADALGLPLDHVLRLEGPDGRELQAPRAEDGPVVHLARDTRLVDAAGRRVPVDCTTSCVRDEAGHTQGTVTLLHDVTGRRHGALAALSEDVAFAAAQAATVRDMLQVCAESLVRNLDAAFARIWITNAAGDTLLLRASAGLYTRLDGTMRQVPVGERKIGRIAARREPHLSNDVLGDPNVDAEWARRERLVSFAGYPLVVGEWVVGVMGLFARRPLPEAVLEALASIASTLAVGVERKRLAEELRQSQKLEAMGQIAAGVAHDFNNMLTVINGYADLLRAREHTEARRGQLLDAIAQAGERAAGLTRQLLAFGRRELRDPRVLDLNAVIHEANRLLERVLGAQVSVALALAPDLSPVLADPGQLEQVLLNLAVNARDAMPAGGRLTIETCDVVLDEGYARTRADVTPGPYVQLAVSDEGCGMPPEVLARAFEPFFTTKEPGKGTGLGLATAYGIVRQSGGHIRVYSEPGVGTTFKVYLPSVSERVQAEARASGEAPLPAGTETILLVEDERAVRELAALVLRGCGYAVIEAGDGREALEAWARDPAVVDLVVTDVVMPELAGRALFEQLVAERPGLRVLFISGYAEDAAFRHDVVPAACAFLSKPFSPTGLARAVREVLDRG
ncbi:MAG: PAS domain S-box protein [Planctomycetota bacterium]